MKHFAEVVAELDSQCSIFSTQDVQESASRFGVFEGLFDEAVRIGAARIAGGVASDCIFVVQGSAAEFLHAARMDAVKLPMAIAADGEESSDVVLL